MRIKSFKFNGEGKVLIWCCFDIRRVMGAIVRTYQIIMGRAYYKCTLGFSSTSNVTDTKNLGKLKSNYHSTLRKPPSFPYTPQPSQCPHPLILPPPYILYNGRRATCLRP